MNDDRTKAERRLSAMAWWVAATLARRNDRLLVWHSRPLDGFYDCLGVREAEPLQIGTAIEMNRHHGSVHMHNGPEWTPVALGELLLADEPMALVQQIETAAAWTPGARRTTPRSLAYRVIARVLQSLVDERQDWDAELTRPSADGGLFRDAALVEDFPFGREMLATVPQEGRTTFAPFEHVWVLLRGGEPMALVDTLGRVATRDGVTHMMPIYASHRRLEPVIHAALGDVLP